MRFCLYSELQHFPTYIPENEIVANENNMSDKRSNLIVIYVHSIFQLFLLISPILIESKAQLIVQ